jgi:hypothetical protein
MNQLQAAPYQTIIRKAGSTLLDMNKDCRKNLTRNGQGMKAASYMTGMQAAPYETDKKNAGGT